MAKLNEKGYYISEFTTNKSAAHVVEHDADTDLWHRRLRHSSNKILIEISLPASHTFCEECVIVKQSSELKGYYISKFIPIKAAAHAYLPNSTPFQII